MYVESETTYAVVLQCCGRAHCDGRVQWRERGPSAVGMLELAFEDLACYLLNLYIWNLVNPWMNAIGVLVFMRASYGIGVLVTLADPCYFDRLK